MYKTFNTPCSIERDAQNPVPIHLSLESPIHELWVIVGQLDAVASSVMPRILIFTNTHVMSLESPYYIHIHEVWVIVGQLDAVCM